MAAFLAGEVKVQVASLAADGAPHLTTLFHVVDDGRIAFWTYGRSQKVRLDRDPRVSAWSSPGRVLRAAGARRGRVVRDHDEVLRIGAAIVTTMTGVATLDELGDAGRDEVERQAAKRVAVLVHPEHVASWDHAKMLDRQEGTP